MLRILGIIAVGILSFGACVWLSLGLLAFLTRHRELPPYIEEELKEMDEYLLEYQERKNKKKKS